MLVCYVYCVELLFSALIFYSTRYIRNFLLAEEARLVLLIIIAGILFHASLFLGGAACGC